MNLVRLLLCILWICPCISVINGLEAESIVGGEFAQQGQFMYQVSVQLANGHSICGGGIIGDMYVLTAAHCMVDENNIWHPDLFKVVADAANLHNTAGVVADVAAIYLLNNYVPSERIRDIAVLKLKQSLHLNTRSFLKMLLLPESTYPQNYLHSNNDFVGKTAITTGYGFIDVQVNYDQHSQKPVESGGYSHGDLKYASVDITSKDVCEQTNPHFNIDFDKQMCGYVKQHSQWGDGTCRGDSGSPLVYDDIVIGITNFSPIGCREHTTPGIYSRVSYFVPFIEDVMFGQDQKKYMRVRYLPISNHV